MIRAGPLLDVAPVLRPHAVITAVMPTARPAPYPKVIANNNGHWSAHVVILVEKRGLSRTAYGRHAGLRALSTILPRWLPSAVTQSIALSDPNTITRPS